MDKLKKSAVAKVVAAILLSVSLFMAAVSSCVVVAAISYGGSSQMQAEAIYDGYMGNLVDNSSYQVDEYYKAYVESQDDTQENHTIRYYKDYFNEKNSNFYFEVVPDDAKKYPTLSNYKAEEYQYHDVRSRRIMTYTGQTTITCKLSLEDIIDFWKNNYVPDEYDEDYSSYEADETVFATSGEVPMSIRDVYWDWSNISFADMTVVDSAVDDEGNADPYIQLDNTNFIYYLSNNSAYQKAVARATKKAGDVQIYNESLTLDYDGSLTQGIDMYTPVSYTLYAYVRSDLTARDIYAESIVLRYCKPIVNMAPYVLAISLIMILFMGGFLIAASGHRKGQETITCNVFDRIPYDLFIAIAVGLVACGINLLTWYSYSTRDEIFLASICTAVVAFLIPPLLMTTSTRLKASGWAMFANTLIWRLCKLLVRLVKWVFGKLRDTFRFLGRHFNLYWKWIGGLAGIALLRFILVAASGSAGLAIVLDLVCAALLAVFVIRVIVQMYRLKDGAKKIADGETDYKIDTTHMLPEFAAHGETLNCIQDSVRVAVAERMKSERFKTELITNVSHDLKTPLTSILSYAELLRQEPLEGAAADYARIIDEKARRLKSMVQDVFEVSKAAADQLPVHLERLDFAKLVRQTLADMADPIEKSGLAFRVDLPETEVPITADGKRMYRVFQNLIQNALQYALPGSRVYVTLTVSGSRAETAVRNTSRQELPKGLDFTARFVRGDESRTGGGSGLGLSIAKSFTEACGGQFRVETVADLFTAAVSFPLAGEGAPKA